MKSWKTRRDHDLKGENLHNTKKNRMHCNWQLIVDHQMVAALTSPQTNTIEARAFF